MSLNYKDNSISLPNTRVCNSYTYIHLIFHNHYFFTNVWGDFQASIQFFVFILICPNNVKSNVTHTFFNWDSLHIRLNSPNLSSLPHFAGDSRILKRNTVSLPHAKSSRNLPHLSFCNCFSSIIILEKFLYEFYQCLLFQYLYFILFLLRFSFLFWYPWSCLSCMNQFDTVSQAIFVFSSAMENLRNKIKLKSPMHTLSFSKKRWLSRETNKGKKVRGIFPACSRTPS